MQKSFDNEWEKIHSIQVWGQYPSEHIVRFVARNYYQGDRVNIKILDFGCGAGASTWYLAREGFDAYAFDGSESAIRRLQERFAKENLKASVKVSDALQIDYPNNFFDAVIDNFCIYSNVYANICSMYKKIYDVLKPWGGNFDFVFWKKYRWFWNWN